MSNKKVWDFWSRYYRGLWVQKLSLKPTRDVIINKVKAGDLKEVSCLDVGCGVGELVEDLSKVLEGAHFTGLDYSEKMIETARTSIEGGLWLCEDIGTFDESEYEGTFDLVTCTHSFPYYKDQEGVLIKIHKLMKADARAYIAFASSNSLYDQICMFFVKFTTGKARYPSVKDFKRMCGGTFIFLGITCVKERLFMPSIYVFELEKAHD